MTTGPTPALGPKPTAPPKPGTPVPAKPPAPGNRTPAPAPTAGGVRAGHVATSVAASRAPKPPPAPVHAPAPPVHHPAPPPAAPHLSQTQTDAIALMTATLKSWGLDALLPDLRRLVIGGDTSPDTLSLALSQTNAYKTRFKGNEQRLANGLPELNPAQYIATEEQYHNILQSYGLPRGFYDTHADFTDFIGKDISPAELDTRAKIAHDQYTAAPDATKALWSQYFGTQGDAIAAILDPNVATQVIQDRANQVSIGGAAAQQGINVAQPRAQQFTQAGVTLAGAQKAYAQIAQSMPTDRNIAARFGTTFDQTQEENDLLLNNAAATQKRQTLYGEEEGLFKGHGGADANSLGVSQSY